MTAAHESPQRGPDRYRPELHGLRGVAIGLVVLYHVWSGRVSGGVDVFLFLSAFLLTGSFVRRAEARRPLQPFSYWAKTFKRLLPPTVVVSLATLTAVITLLEPERWMPALTDAMGSVGQVENWVLIHRDVDYYAADVGGPSPFQHFWSLSIQGQIFLIWPVLIAVTVAIARRLRVRVSMALLVVFSMVLLASLVWSVYSTAAQQQVAYFDTRTRAWEFAAGSVLALLLPTLERRRAAGAHRAIRVALGWCGLLALLLCGLLVDVRGAFPGWIALWPLGAAALVLLAGDTGHPLSVDRMLSTRPARILGDISYALYLVHWPLLTIALALLGRERASFGVGAALILASLLLAWLLTRAVDQPIRRSVYLNAVPYRAAAVAVLALVVGLAPPFAYQQHLLAQERDLQARAVADNPGARVLDPSYEPHPDRDAHAPFLPTTALAGKDCVGVPGTCEGELAPSDPELADLCHVQSAGEDAPVLVSIGNSRMEQFTGAILPLAAERGWSVVTLWEGGCTFSPEAQISPDCDAYSSAARAYLETVRPDAVLLATTFFTPAGEEIITPGLEETIPALLAQGTQVIALRDQPRLPIDPPVCIDENGVDASDCAPPIPAPLTAERPDTAQIAQLSGGRTPIVPIDVNDLVCPDGICSPIIGNVLVSIDRFHISATFAASMQDAVDARLQDAGFRWRV